MLRNSLLLRGARVILRVVNVGQDIQPSEIRAAHCSPLQPYVSSPRSQVSMRVPKASLEPARDDTSSGESE